MSRTITESNIKLQLILGIVETNNIWRTTIRQRQQLHTLQERRKQPTLCVITFRNLTIAKVTNKKHHQHTATQHYFKILGQCMYTHVYMRNYNISFTVLHQQRTQLLSAPSVCQTFCKYQLVFCAQRSKSCVWVMCNAREQKSILN